MGKLSTHVLDITKGKPGAGVKLALYAVAEGGKTLLKHAVTNSDGRFDRRCWKARRCNCASTTGLCRR
jgi:5-hydroxyisourate hydrolase